jgi:tetratricopeptide (TPR) repeat protein
MKYYTSLLLAASLAFGIPVMAQTDVASRPQNDLYRSVQTSIRGKKYPEAIAQAEQALRTDGLLAADKVRFLNIAADASMFQTPPQYVQAKKFYEQIIADPALANSDKVDALNNLSNAYIASLAGEYLDTMDLAPAYSTLNRALQLANLNTQDHATALENIGRLYERQDKYAEAIAAYQKAAEFDAKGAQQLIAGVYANQGNVDKVIALYHKYNLDFIPLYKRLNDYTVTPRFDQSADIGKADEEMFRILDNPKVPDKDRWNVFTNLNIWERRGNGNYYPLMRQQLVDIQKIASKYLPEFLETDPNRALVLLYVFKSPATPVFQNDFYLRSLANPKFIVWAAPLLLKAPRLSDKDYTFVKQKQSNALIALGDISQATAELQSIATNPRVGASTRFWAQLSLAGLASNDSAISKIIQQENDGLDRKTKAETIIDSAQTVLLAGNDEASNKLYNTYEAMLPQLPTATINCAFTSNAPSDVGSWLTSPLLDDAKSSAKLDRPYGDNLKALVETDAATSGRNAGTSDKSTGDTNTDFHIACDAQGIHFFFDAHDTQAQEVVDGLLSGDSFETYLAPGKNQAYYTFIPRLPNGDISTAPGAFITMYPNSGFRLPSTDDGTLRNSILPTKDGFGVSVFLSWELFYDKLPIDGTKWQFESIRWTRSGGHSFAGSQSVHNRSSWGDIIFSGMTPENLTAIKRGIIFKAVAKYRDAKKITSPVGRWADAELGDPVFFQGQVAPLLARLDKYADIVNENMTSSDVDTIFNEAVPDWMEINFRVAALRKQYLEAKLFAR